MNYEVFKEGLMEKVEARCEGSVIVKMMEVDGNNGIKHDVIAIMDRQNSFFVGPTFPMMKYYGRFLKNEAMDSLADEIMGHYSNNRKPRGLDAGIFHDKEKFKERIVYRLISYDRNRERLEDCPHVRYLDLAVTFHYLLPGSTSVPNQQKTILVTDQTAQRMGLEKETLLSCAHRNTPRLLEELCKPTGDILFDLMGDGLNQQEAERMRREANGVGLYVLTNSDRIYGVAAILYPGVLRACAQSLGGDLYLLPSSVHEVLIHPVGDDDADMADNLNWMVRSTNREQVSEEEILSDHAYLYDRAKDEVWILE